MQKPPTTAIVLLAVLLASCVTLAAREAGAAIVGALTDEAGQPLEGCRVVARVAGGTSVFVSSPSDGEGRYRVAVPSGASYVLVAVVSPTAGRLALPESEPLEVGGADVSRDVRVQLPTPSESRMIGGASPRGTDRLFLSFVEDTALVERGRFEVRVDFADFESGDLMTARGTAAFQFSGLPDVELGIRAGYAEIDIGAFDDSGSVDLELWAKILLRRWGGGKFDLATGAVLTLPTGDTDVGLGRDAVQSKAFFAASYALPSAILVGNVGVRFSEHGKIGGQAIDGEVAASAGVGVLLPFTKRMSLVFEADYEDEQFSGLQSDSNLLFGADWRSRRHVLRAAVAGGLEDSSADLTLMVGYAYDF